MKKLALPLTALALALAGCGTQSGSTAVGSTATGVTPTGLPSTGANASASSVSTPSNGPGATSPVVPPFATVPTGSAGPTPSSPPTFTGGAVPVPPSATSATLTYVGPPATHRLHVTKNVTGATYQRLADDLDALQPMGATMQCMVLTGEDASITVTGGGHTIVYRVDGSPCRGVSVTQDGVAAPRMAGSMTLTNQVRAIAGYTGLAHPLTG